MVWEGPRGRVDLRWAMREVRRARVSETAVLAEMLARAFALDPVALDLFPAESGRARRMRRFFAIQLRHTYFPRGEVMTLPDLSSAALVVWPDAPTASAFHQLASLRLVPLLRGQIFAAQQMGRAILATHPSTPHVYLGTIGTDPALQGSGRGTALIEELLQRCDAAGLSCRLEASTTSNVTFYEGFGFRCIQEFPIRTGGPMLYVMHRLPGRADQARP